MKYLLSALLLTFCSFACAFPETFISESTRSSTRPDEAIAADMDGDGDSDIVKLAGYTNILYWYENGQNGAEWTTHTIAAIGHWTRVAVADFNGDGYPDVISSVWQSSYSIKLFLNPGSDGIWTTSDVFTNSVMFDSARPIDLNGDPYPDIVVATYGTLMASYTNPGGSGPVTDQWSLQVLTKPFGETTQMESTDIDGDGDQDLLALLARTSIDGPPHQVHWYRNENGTMEDAGTLLTISHKPYGFDLADIDGDGLTDIALGTMNDFGRPPPPIAWYNNPGTEAEWTSTTIASEPTALFGGVADLRLADLDYDGDQDLITGTVTNLADKGEPPYSTLVWYENTAIEWIRHPVPTTWSGINSVSLADIDNDGAMDILTNSYHGSKAAWYRNPLDWDPTAQIDLQLVPGQISLDGKLQEKRTPAFYKLKISAVVANGGEAKAAPTLLSLFVSDDGQLDGSDQYLGQVKVPAIKPQKQRKIRRKLKVPNASWSATSHLLAILDAENTQIEMRKGNNQSAIAPQHLPPM